jgi:hypothetical protein
MPVSFSRSTKYKAEQGNSPADEGGKQAGNSLYSVTCKYTTCLGKKQGKNQRDTSQ